MIEQIRVYQTLRHWRDRLRSPDYRETDNQARAEFDGFCRHQGGLGLKPSLLPRDVKPRTALLVSLSIPAAAKLEGIAIKALQMAGFETVVLGTRRYDFLRYYRLAGANTVIAWSDVATDGDPAWVDQALSRLSTLRDWLTLTYEGAHVGRFAVASAMRHLKKSLDFDDPGARRVLRHLLQSSVSYTLSGLRLLAHVRPECLLFLDRGYVAQGEIFDLALAQGIDTLTWNGGYKSNLLFFKRYHAGNEREHHAAPSPDSWRRLCSVPWKPEYGRRIREELFHCYDSQDWFSSYGVQFGKTIHSQQATRDRLHLSPGKKVAVIFPHILWDGSFFWGDDLFDDYTHWFVETIRAACANPRLEWVVKVHPGHVVKSKREGIAGRPRELEVIEETVGTLPAHVKVLHPDTELSTYSLFQVADYAVTVRGTVGIEASLFGVLVVTAGTGRYAWRGFTLDSATREEYLEKLATLETQPGLSPEQIELAERFAYGMFFCRPLTLSSVSLEFERDAVATSKVSVRCQTRDEWLSAPDMRQLASWIADGKADDMLAWPFAS